MIFYFSATGNCKHVAGRIARATGDEARDIIAATRAGETTFACDEGEVVGLVTPTYAWELPAPVVEWLQAFDVVAQGEAAHAGRERPEADGLGNRPTAKPYSFLVSTFGTTPGQTYGIAQGLARGRGYAPFDAGFCVRMPDTWTPTFDLSDPDKVARQNSDAEPRIDRIIAQVQGRAQGDFVHPKTPRIAKPLAHHFYEGMRETRHLHVTDACIGCGACAKRCPVQAIEMCDKHPTWVVDRCAMCLGCLHRCPKFAIQYDDRTQHHGQYRHP